MPRYVELNHVIENGQVTYPGLPAPLIEEHMSREASRANYAPGTEFSIGRITMVGNTGTYLDSPFHRFADGADLADLPLDRLDRLAGALITVAEGSGRAIGPDLFAGHDVRGKAVLFHTGWDRLWATPAYADGNPFLTADAASALVNAGAALVGIDSLNIDDTADKSRPAHTRLLQAGIPIVEHMTGLGSLPVSGFTFSAVPTRIRGFGTWPVRAFAVID
jgi:kynurenine formamidase